MSRPVHRMVLEGPVGDHPPPPSADVVRYHPARHHDAVPRIYSRAFGEPPWPSDWDVFDEFDPEGAFVAEDVTGPIGFVLGFPRGDHGYISVVAVVPEWSRRGVGAALVRAAVDQLRAAGFSTVKIDAFVDSVPAVSLYRKLGFRIEAPSKVRRPSSPG